MTDFASLTHSLKVKKKIEETFDTSSFALEVPDSLREKFKYVPGQFLTLLVTVQGEQLRRSYSISSSPSCDSDLIISVKRVKDGKVSNFLIDHIKEGDTLHCTPPAGIFVVPKSAAIQHFVFFAGGSGITPILSIIKELLLTTSARCSLLYANRNENSIIFHRQLKDLTSKYPERFTIEYVISAPQKEFRGPTGRLTAEIAQDFITRVGALSSRGDFAFVCGPEGFMATAEATLSLSGFSKDQIAREIFVSPLPSASEKTLELEDDAVFIGDKGAEKTVPKTIEITLNGETTTIPYQDGTTVLDAALEARLNPPYSCMDGACMACIGKVKSGLVYQNDMGILTEDYIEGGECLTCQARPISNSVKISFDM